MKLDEIYEMFDEDSRLNSTKSSQIEFIITTSFIDKYLTNESTVLDIGAGTGAYSLYYAAKEFRVMAIEPVLKNLDVLKSKITPDMKLNARLGNALDMAFIEDNSYDVVLCLGPLYHLDSIDKQLQCIKEVKRVCKPGGIMFFAYISNDMVVVTETFKYNPNFLTGSSYDHSTFNVKNFPFVFLTVERAKELMAKAGLKPLHHFAADGLSELLSEKINKMDDDSFKQWVNYQKYVCEKEEMLGYSNHIVYVAKNK